MTGLRRCPTVPGWGALTARVPGPVQSGPCLEKTQRAPRLGFDLLLRSRADQRCLPLFLLPRLCKGIVLMWDSVWNFVPCFVVGLGGDEQTAAVRRWLRKSQPTPHVGLATFECGCVSEITLGHSTRSLNYSASLEERFPWTLGSLFGFLWNHSLRWGQMVYWGADSSREEWGSGVQVIGNELTPIGGELLTLRCGQ